MTQTVTRFAPSPTGFMHIGSLRTAAYAYTLAKHSGGKFILRIEDTDQSREVEGATEKLQEIMRQFGLVWDEFYIQSKRVGSEIYKKSAVSLVAEGKAFYCQCEAKNAKTEGYTKVMRDPCRDLNLSEGAIKLKVPEDVVVKYTDYVLGKEVQWNTSTVADPTLLKTDGFPTYHLAVVVDDHDMGVTHVLRGHDWMPSTPIHLLVYEYLGFQMPEIGHLTDILDPAGGKLSKRKGTVSVESFLAQGYLTEALFNFVILMGWAPKDNRELFDLQAYVENFDKDGFQTSNPVMNLKKLDWFNGHYIRQMSASDLKGKLKPFLNEKATDEELEVLTPLVQERIETLAQVKALTDFIWEDVNVWPDSGWKAQAYLHLVQAFEVIKATDTWSVESLNKAFMDLIEKNGWKVGHFFMNLRTAVSGQGITPPITECIFIMGKERVEKRLEIFLKTGIVSQE